VARYIITTNIPTRKKKEREGKREGSRCLSPSYLLSPSHPSWKERKKGERRGREIEASHTYPHLFSFEKKKKKRKGGKEEEREGGGVALKNARVFLIISITTTRQEKKKEKGGTAVQETPDSCSLRSHASY